MHFASIPKTATPNEVAVLLLYDPLRDNRKEVRYILHYRYVSSVNRVLRKYQYILTIQGSPQAPLPVYPFVHLTHTLG